MPNDSFPHWGSDHLGALVVIGLLVILSAILPRYLSPAGRNYLRRGFAALCFTGLAFGIVIELRNPEKIAAEAIPFHLCSVSLLLTAIGLIRRSPLCLEWCYIYGIGGVAQAVLTPDLPTGFPSLKYLVFFFNHGAILMGVAYLMGVEGMRPRPGAFARLWVWGTVYMFSAMAINTAFGSNFGYLARKPDRPSLLDSLGAWPYYILWMQGLGIVKIVLLLLPFANRRALIFSPPGLAQDFPSFSEQSTKDRVSTQPD